MWLWLSEEREFDKVSGKLKNPRGSLDFGAQCALVFANMESWLLIFKEILCRVAIGNKDLQKKKLEVTSSGKEKVCFFYETVLAALAIFVLRYIKYAVD